MYFEKEIANKLEAAGEEAESAMKRVDKKIRVLTEDVEALGSDVARGGGAALSPTKRNGGSGAFGGDKIEEEEASMKLRAKVAALSGVVERVETLRAELKDVQSRLDGSISSERHTRDLKEIQTSLHDVEALQGKDVRLLRDSIHALEDATAVQHKQTMERLIDVEDKVARSGGGGGGGAVRSGLSDPPSGPGASSPHSRSVELVEKEVAAVQSQLDSLARKVKEQGNESEDAVNRLAQEGKKVVLRVEALESQVNAAAASGPKHSIAAAAAAADASSPAAGAKVDALESELKLKTLPALTLQVETLQSKLDLRTRELDARLNAHDGRIDRAEAEAKALSASVDEIETKATKRARELSAAVEAQSARDLETQSALRGEMKSVGRRIDDLEDAQKAQVRSVDEKLSQMEWSLEYAKDTGFKNDVKQIRAGAEAPPPQVFHLAQAKQKVDDPVVHPHTIASATHLAPHHHASASQDVSAGSAVTAASVGAGASHRSQQASMEYAHDPEHAEADPQSHAEAEASAQLKPSCRADDDGKGSGGGEEQQHDGHTDEQLQDDTRTASSGDSASRRPSGSTNAAAHTAASAPKPAGAPAPKAAATH